MQLLGLTPIGGVTIGAQFGKMVVIMHVPQVPVHRLPGSELPGTPAVLQVQAPEAVQVDAIGGEQ